MMNLMMPGQPRYQPAELVPYFGHDNLVRPLGQVEIAGLNVLGEIGVIPPSQWSLLTPDVATALLAIPTSRVDEIERTITKHDVRAWVHVAKEIIPKPLHRYLHVPYTSYDGLDTGRVLMFLSAYRDVIRPKIKEVIRDLADLAERFVDQPQIGRTHGQHALPITVGFWLSTIISRVLANWEQIELASDNLVGKISGAVGAYNAQVGLGIEARCGDTPFEVRVLHKLGLEPARISTQILPPEPLAYFLHAIVWLTAAFGQLGCDCRHLMRPEIGEIAEDFEPGQVGSSTMPHKRNPVTFEQIQGAWERTQGEYLKVLRTAVSEHQRDLVGSSVARDFPIIPINLTLQLNALLRRDKQLNRTFLRRFTVDREACMRNLGLTRGAVMGEAIYISLQMAGYEGDAHQLINEEVMPRARAQGAALYEVVEEMAFQSDELDRAYRAIPADVREGFRHPERYIGHAVSKANSIVALAREMTA